MSFGSLAPDSVVGGHVGGPVTFLHLGLPLYSALGPRARGQINAPVWSGLAQPGPVQAFNVLCEQSWASRARGGECAGSFVLCGP